MADIREFITQAIILLRGCKDHSGIHDAQASIEQNGPCLPAKNGAKATVLSILPQYRTAAASLNEPQNAGFFLTYDDFAL